MIIECIEITMKPFFINPHDVELRIEVQTDKNRYGVTKVYPRDHFISDFDHIFKYAKEILRQEVEKAE